MSNAVEQMLDRAGRAGDDEAQKIYLDILRREPTHLAALSALGVLAHRGGHRSAARTVFEHAVRHHPGDPATRINLGNLLLEDGDAAVARAEFEAALALDENSRPAHRGLAQSLTALGMDADSHWRKSFDGQAIDMRHYRGAGPGISLLLLVSARGGNIPTASILDDRIFAVTALYAEYYNPALSLPHHDLLFNAIGDADLCPEALEIAARIAARGNAINPPEAVRRTGREENARRLADMPDVIAPAIRTFARDQPLADMDFPLLLRAPGFHTGQHFIRVEKRANLTSAIASLPGPELLAIPYLDARGADGLARKYRVMIIDGKLYPLHLATAPNWKVHYFTAAMNEAACAEEKHFLENMDAVLGPRAIAALYRIGDILGLDYMGVDFALAPDGALLLFEANATMVLNPPPPDPIFDYRRASIARALEAARRMVLDRTQRF